ncbi:MAG: hypothetical protein IIT97_01955 [Mycoplasmataceae bacterium]|nr:hypothetical protein [Mycoplasmataceae bacterium]
MENLDKYNELEQLDNKNQNQSWEITISLKLLGNLFFYWWFLVVTYGLYTFLNIIVVWN